MKYTDIKIRDKTYWDIWRNSFNGNKTLDNSYINSALTRVVFNNITTSLTSLMTAQPDPAFKANIIKTQEAAPSGMTSGDVYFQLIIPSYMDTV